LELVYGIGNIVLNWLLGNIDMHFVICTNFSQRSSIIIGISNITCKLYLIYEFNWHCCKTDFWHFVLSDL